MELTKSKFNSIDWLTFDKIVFNGNETKTWQCELFTLITLFRVSHMSSTVSRDSRLTNRALIRSLLVVCGRQWRAANDWPPFESGRPLCNFNVKSVNETKRKNRTQQRQRPIDSNGINSYVTRVTPISPQNIAYLTVYLWAMAEEQEQDFSKLSIEERCSHKVIAIC